MKTAKDFDALPTETVEIKGRPKKAKEFLDEYYKTLGDGTREYLGIRTGLEKLDKKTLGLDGLIVLGGIPGAGKTSLALQIAYKACEGGTPTLFYSLEMPRRAMFTKILNRLSKVKYSDILLKGRRYLADVVDETALQLHSQDEGRLSSEEVSKLRSAKNVFAGLGETFYFRSRERGEADINFETVEKEINAIKAEHNRERVFVVVDHLQIFDAGDYKDQIDREDKLITGFKRIHEQTGAVILLLSQKNKGSFRGMAGLEAIKGSVSLTYTPEVVMFLEGKDEKNGGKELDGFMAECEGGEVKDVDLIIAKNRHNAPGKIEMSFYGAYSEFKEK